MPLGNILPSVDGLSSWRHGILNLAGLALLVGLGGIAAAQDDEQAIQCKKLPAAVRSAFEKTYRAARIKSCAKETEKGKTAYEIASVEGNIGRDVLYHPDGSVIVVEETIAVDSLPTPVQKALHEKFPKGKIVLAEKLIRGSSISYEFQIRNKGKTVEIALDPQGNEIEQ